MASRILLSLGGGMARSARGRGLLLPSGHSPLPAGVLGRPRPGTIFSAVQSRYASTEVQKTLDEFDARIQALERSGTLADQRLELLERQAEAAERRAEAAEKRAELAAKRSDMAEKQIEILARYAQARDWRTDRLEYSLSMAFKRISLAEEDCHKNFFVMLHLHSILASEVARQRESISNLKIDYRNAVLDAKNSVSATTWRIILTLLSGFGAITVFYLPYVVSNIKQEVLAEVTGLIKEKLVPVLEELKKLKTSEPKPRRWWFWGE